MKTVALLIASVLAVNGIACNEPLPQVDRMEADITVGAEFCNWTPVENGSSSTFDLAGGLEVKEGVGIALRPSPKWLPDPSDLDSARGLSGIPLVTSATPDVEAFSAPDGTVALLARKPGKASLRFGVAGHPGTIDVTVTVVPSDEFVDRDETGSDTKPDPTKDAGTDASPETDAGTETDASTEGDAS